METDTERLYNHIDIKYLEEGITKQLTEQHFVFNTVKIFHELDICEFMDRFLIEIDKIIVRYSAYIDEHKSPDEIIKAVCDSIIATCSTKIKYRKHKVYCQHCGAPIQTNERICPYCEQPYIEFKEEV